MASLNPRRGESCKSMFAHGSSMHQKCSNYALTNLLFNLCKSMWIIDPLVTHFNPHPGTLARPSTPKVLQARDRTLIIYTYIFFHLGFIIESIEKLGGASILMVIGQFCKLLKMWPEIILASTMSRGYWRKVFFNFFMCLGSLASWNISFQNSSST